MKNKLPVNVILQDVRSALNVGAIFRTCDACNVDTLYLSGITPYPPHNKIPKTALGAIDMVSWVHNKDIQEVINEVKGKGNKIVSIELTKDARNIFEYDFSYPTTIVMGNEISGVSSEVLSQSDDIIYIPMFGEKESLNVATTTGIVLYEIVRQYYYNEKGKVISK